MTLTADRIDTTVRPAKTTAVPAEVSATPAENRAVPSPAPMTAAQLRQLRAFTGRTPRALRPAWQRTLLGALGL